MDSRFLRFCLLYLVLLLLVAYAGAWNNLIVNGEVNPNFLNLLSAIPRSLSYLIQWVLPYWWLVILGGTLILAAISTGISWLAGKWT
jgi:hypothetical protein